MCSICCGKWSIFLMLYLLCLGKTGLLSEAGIDVQAPWQFKPDDHVSMLWSFSNLAA
jgi:hypothetical protein